MRIEQLLVGGFHDDAPCEIVTYGGHRARLFFGHNSASVMTLDERDFRHAVVGARSVSGVLRVADEDRARRPTLGLAWVQPIASKRGGEALRLTRGKTLIVRPDYDRQINKRLDAYYDELCSPSRSMFEVADAAVPNREFFAEVPCCGRDMEKLELRP